MRRKLRILWALIRCDWYLWTGGMWRGELRMVGEDASGRITIIAAVGFTESGPVVSRYFYPEDDK